MTGLELSKQYYLEFGAPMLHEQFPELEGLVAAGLTGSGSECYGYDDEISRDHDFEPGFCLFLPGEDVVDRKTAFRLERAYAKLPKEFAGFTRAPLSPVGGSRHGVMRTAEYFRDKTGCEGGIPAASEWFTIPEYALCEAVNGEIFRDDYGEVTAIRAALSAMPEDVRLKKLAGNLLLMAQAGQYNYRRCLDHGETAAAQLAVCEYVKSTINVIFLLNKRYQPYYKWCFRALRELPLLSETAGRLEMLLTTPNDGASLVREKYNTIEELAGSVIAQLQADKLTEAVCGDLEKHAYSVNDRVADGSIRNANILSAV